MSGCTQQLHLPCDRSWHYIKKYTAQVLDQHLKDHKHSELLQLHQSKCAYRRWVIVNPNGGNASGLQGLRVLRWMPTGASFH